MAQHAVATPPLTPESRLHTPRLVLLPAHEDLAGRVAAFYRRNAAHLAPWDPPAPEGFATEAFQAGRLCKAVTEAAAGTALRWWIEPREEPSQLVGSIGLSQIARGAFQNAMLGYAIDSAYEGKGLMREALEAVIGHAFSEAVCLHRIQANVRPENLRSVALLMRLGFDEEGLAREYLFIDGAWRDHRMFALRNTAYPGAPQY